MNTISEIPVGLCCCIFGQFQGCCNLIQAKEQGMLFKKLAHLMQ